MTANLKHLSEASVSVLSDTLTCASPLATIAEYECATINNKGMYGITFEQVSLSTAWLYIDCLDLSYRIIEHWSCSNIYLSLLAVWWMNANYLIKVCQKHDKHLHNLCYFSRKIALSFVVVFNRNSLWKDNIKNTSDKSVWKNKHHRNTNQKGNGHFRMQYKSLLNWRNQLKC